MSPEDQQPIEAPEPEGEAGSGPAPDEAPHAAGPEPEAGAGEDDADARFAELPVAEQLRRLREQFEDPRWRDRPTRLVLSRTAEEDPLGLPWLALAFEQVSRREGALERSWVHAQTALDATLLGRLDRPVIGLLPAGGAFRVVLHFPALGGSGTLTRRGWRTPVGAVRDAERTFVRMLIRENAGPLAARQAAERAAAGEPAGPDATPAAGDDAAAGGGDPAAG